MGIGGGADVNYDKVRRIIKEELAAQEKMFEKQQSYDKWATQYNASASQRIGDMNAAAAGQAANASKTGAYVAAGASVASAGIIAAALI
jgi:hypothetical protein